ncbi:uncharacterized protein LOC112468986 isoform X2 [Temnothorax curvispinosus]|uniref:Uncharacterized protein LOC112468986 isoform X2 n=1 Tax=Temnothorax curvispinosus TaxID=300111 RepID=A0A6J1RGS5_9HYME|nr:uncharacterized protein LOC112468986 isoform X2 [Temnothorax curvispinosus]
MQSTCQQQQAQPGQNGTSASRTSFLIEDILSRGTVTPHVHHHQLHHQHLTPTSGHGQHHQYQQFASLLPGYPTAPPAAAAFFLGPLFGSAGMGVGVVPGVGELAALKHCRRRKARTETRVCFLTASGIQRPAAGRFGSEVRGAEIPEHAREGRAGGGVTPVRDASENVVPESTDEAQEAAEEAEHER